MSQKPVSDKAKNQTRSYRKLLIFAALGLLCACGSQVTDDSPVVARYKKQELTQNQLDYHIPSGLGDKDSSRFARNYIDQWIKEQVIAEKSIEVNPDLEKEIEFKVRDYRQKLLVHEYRTHLIEKDIDTVVIESEIREYYNSNQSKFLSNEGLVSYFYLAVANTDKAQVSQVKKWMDSDVPSDIESLRKWTSQGNALEFKLDSLFKPNSELDRLAKGFFVNLKNAPIGQLITWNGVKEGERRKYFFKKLSIANAGEPLPLSLTRDRIKQILLKERTLTMIEKREKELVDDARSSKKIFYY